ncbi:recombinase RecA [Neorhizobium sp. P12A]|uniref:AAA family ATPase n=1 Tax=Neorhizobium sp. P12A TaxID=2268027 RepID=UPI0011EEC9AA|nr:AAA family ATPase [Neorhizobium sp. P12A]KAA0699978.1 recombinase RecA [Neorhizobium sp. P12A]
MSDSYWESLLSQGAEEHRKQAPDYSDKVAAGLGAGSTSPAFAGVAPKFNFRAQEFVWIDPANIPPRDWVYQDHLIRKFVSTTIAPGGVGKSTVTIGDAIAMASGLPFMGRKINERHLRTMIWNGEDPQDELQRRVTATMLHHKIDPRGPIRGRLFVASGRDMPIKISDDNQRIATPVVDALIDAINDACIDVLIIDPFVSVHSLPENDNGAMDAAVKAFAMVADKTNCAIELVHHSRKLNGIDADIDSARGGSAIAGAVRAARVLNVMTKEAAGKLGIEENERRSLIRDDNAKSNLCPPSGARWYKLMGEPLGNQTEDRPGDWIGVAAPWTAPQEAAETVSDSDLLAVQKALHNQVMRHSPQASDWAGYKVGEIVGIALDAVGKRRVDALIDRWVKEGWLKVEQTRDNRHKLRPTVNVGKWAPEPKE